MLDLERLTLLLESRLILVIAIPPNADGHAATPTHAQVLTTATPTDGCRHGFSFAIFSDKGSHLVRFTRDGTAYILSYLNLVIDLIVVVPN